MYDSDLYLLSSFDPEQIMTGLIFDYFKLRYHPGRLKVEEMLTSEPQDTPLVERWNLMHSISIETFESAYEQIASGEESMFDWRKGYYDDW